MWRWIFILALGLVSVGVPPAAAEDQLDISVTVPLNGTVKYNSWTRLEVTVNNQDEAFNGALELGNDSRQPRDMQATIRQDVTVGKGETKQFFFDVPTEAMINGNPIFRLTQDEKVIRTESILPIRPQGERTVGVINQSDSAFHFLTLGSGNQQTKERTAQGSPFHVQHLKVQSLPTQSWILKNIDILAMGSAEVKDVNDEQLVAIKEWIYRGGTVILSAGPNQDDVIQRFGDMLPIESGMSGNRTDLQELRGYIAENQVTIDALPVYNRNQPLFVSKQFGTGVLLFANYDVTEEPLASWQYNRLLWQNVLAKHNVMESLEKRDERGSIDSGFLQMSKYIPGVSAPSVGWIISIWIVYLAFVAPLLYFGLKRINRREWAWGIIPISAIVLSAGVFLIGKPFVVKTDTTFNVSSLRILDETLAEVQTAASFVSVSGGDYGVETEKGFLAVPLGQTNGSFSPEGIVYTDLKEQTNTLAFTDVPYLSIKQAIANGLRKDIGSFVSSLSVNGDRLQGTVKNNTSFTLTETYIDLGLQRIAVGELKQGEEKQVDAKIESYYLPSQYDDNGKQQSREEKAESIKQNTLLRTTTNQVRIIATSKQDFPILTMHKENQAHYLSVISQSLKLAPSKNGKVVYPYGTLPVNILTTDGSFDSKSQNLWELGKGNVTFGLAIGQVQAKVDRVQLPLDNSSYRPFKKEILHVKSGQWNQLEREQGIDLRGNLSEYINPEGMILIRFTNTTDQRISLPLPFFQVEGEERSS